MKITVCNLQYRFDLRKGIPTGTKLYKNEVIQSYDNLEPRFSASYQLNDAQSIKASYNRMTQYLQLISHPPLLH
jgi:hypothetical protein